ncbi:sialate O-acetylesterase [Niabella ginsengisoli]|uniref:sialate O-acetylesterase n=1 Tax=Niabella ginsengisoli TaxID=522298 RepID=UPI0021D47307|nr:sialate O-acetylesterase [Niabella ginsengisoli]
MQQEPDLLKAAAAQNPTPWWPVKTSYAYNAMIAPLTNFSIAGAIWYQGESNVMTYGTYSNLFTTMIKAWRNIWQKDFPFYFVQIAPFNYGNYNVGNLVREQQTQSLNLENTGMVVITDLVDDVKIFILPIKLMLLYD